MAGKEDYIRVIKGQRWLIGILLMVMGIFIGAGGRELLGSDIDVKVSINTTNIATIKNDVGVIKSDIKILLQRTAKVISKE